MCLAGVYLYVVGVIGGAVAVCTRVVPRELALASPSVVSRHRPPPAVNNLSACVVGWGRYAKLFVDNTLVWSHAFDESVGTATTCGNEGVDAIVPITVRVAHHEAQAILRFASTIEAGDLAVKSWGVRSVAVYASTPTVNVAYQTNFAEVGAWVFSSTVDSTQQVVTKCGDYNVLGGYGNLDLTDFVELSLDDLTPHSSMTITFDFVRIDTWDNE